MHGPNVPSCGTPGCVQALLGAAHIAHRVESRARDGKGQGGHKEQQGWRDGRGETQGGLWGTHCPARCTAELHHRRHNLCRPSRAPRCRSTAPQCLRSFQCSKTTCVGEDGFRGSAPRLPAPKAAGTEQGDLSPFRAPPARRSSTVISGPSVLLLPGCYFSSLPLPHPGSTQEPLRPELPR